MKFYVYAHFRKSDNKIFYIGKGSGKRFSSSTKRNRYWNFVVAKHDFTPVILKTFLTEEMAYGYEAYLISVFRDKFKLSNLQSGGSGGKGYTLSNDTKIKISAALRRRVVKESTKKKISLALTGSTFSRKRKSKFPSNNRKSLMCLETQQYFDNTHEAGRALNLPYWNIAAVCRGERKSCGGLHFSYV